MVNERKTRCCPLLILLLLCLSLLALTLPQEAEAAGQSDPAPIGDARVIDEADLLTDAEEQALDAKIAAIEKAHRVRILVGTLPDTHDQVLGKVANNVVDQIPGENGTIVLLLATKNRDFYVSTDNKMRARITDGKGVDYLAGEFLPDLKENRYAAAFTAFAATTDEMLTYYEEEGKPYDPGDAFSLLTFAIALGCAALLALFIYYELINCAGNVTRKAEANAYLNHESFHLTTNEDNFLYTSVRRKRKEKEESSSSGGGSNITTSSRDSSHGGSGRY